MGLGSVFRIERLAGVAAAMAACGLAAGCDRLSELEAPATVQLVCTPRPTAGPTATTASGVMILVIDTGDKSVRWLNAPGAPAGDLSVKDHQYEFAFATAGTPPWRATVNRFDGVMTRDLGPPGPSRTRQTLACKREAEGPKL